jgi:V/A-type H+-transporting ATPase subunit E
MGLEEIVEEIKAKGQEEAEKISNEADQEVSRIIAEAQSRAARIKAAKQEDVRKDIDRLRHQELSSANLEVKRAVLNARKEILDEVYEASKEEIRKLPVEKNQQLLSSIIRKNEANNSRIFSSEKDKTAVTRITKLKHSGSISCLGGVVIENEDGTEYLDFKYDTILKNVSDQSLRQVSDILFG